MTEPPHPHQSPTGFGGPDPTRDIRLPSLPDRPPSAMPREWAAMQPEEPGPDFSAPPPDVPPTDDVAPPPLPGTAPAKPGPLLDQPTDELDPPRGRSRERTLAFASPEMAGGRPAPTVGPTPRRPRRWPLVVLALLPVLVIAGAGIALLVLLRGA
jgi:hypothetical protein